MENLKAIEILARHAITTLPDSLESRRFLLLACRDALPINNNTRNDAQSLLVFLKQQDALQADLALSYSQNQDGHHDGHFSK